MAHFQAVRSGLAISQSIADMLERADPTQYNGANRVQTIRETNDILQDRSELSLDMLYSLLAQTCGGEAGQVEKIRRDVEAFCVQKSNRARRYTLTGAQEYHYEMWDFDPKRPLKIISQPLFDHAAEHGFPPDFFTESYFDHVTIYCMPDNVDCSFSQFQSCQFSVCGIRGAVFDNATLDDTDFHSALLRIDDLGAERNTEYALEQMFSIIDSRYRCNKPLIVTTNMKLNELKHPPDLAHARIYDRILECCAPILFAGKNFREDNAASTKAAARCIVSADHSKI